MAFTISNPPAELESALTAIEDDFPERFSSNGISLQFEENPELPPGGCCLQVQHPALTLQYGGITGALRGLGRLMGQLAAETEPQAFTETPAFDTIGIMLDNSRNVVMNVETVKWYLRRCALMGINQVMLYTEDTYQVPEQPFFGYLRGAYTQQDLKTMDAYAQDLGIEMVPCIQTLGHLEQFLQWPPTAKYHDTQSVVLADDEETYALLEACIATVAACFRSPRIHLGMDEAHGLGSGAYRRKYGEKQPYDIMNTHLARVAEICRKYDREPMIWSDMYFRLGSETHEYYDENWQIPGHVVDDIPDGVDLVYWDYYHMSADHYERFIEFHRDLNKEPIFAGGIWTWNRLWCGLSYSVRTTNACMAACRKQGLRQVFMTMWGDDGAECDPVSALPGLQHFAELAYAEQVDETLRAANLLGSCGYVWNDWALACQIDTNRFFHDSDGRPSNAAKALLWQDPLLPLMEPLTADKPLAAFYRDLAAQLEVAAACDRYAAKLTFPAMVAKILSLKTNLRTRLASAYVNGDRRQLRELCEGDLAALQDAVRALWRYHRKTWMKQNAPFGWEVIELRYGGLLARLDTAARRLQQWISGELHEIPELAVNLHNPWPGVEDGLPQTAYARLKTPSAIK